MQRRKFLSYVVGHCCLGASACGMSGCGTMFHHDRVGQPHTNEIDWKIAALDGLGLLLFFVPGVAAFAVDFYTGAIYVPIEETIPPYDNGPSGYDPPPPTYGPPTYGRPAYGPPGQAPEGLPLPPPITGEQVGPPNPRGPISAPIGTGALPPPPRLGLRRIAVPVEELRPHSLEQVVSKHMGRPVSLSDQRARVSVLPRIESFDQQARRHRTDRNFGFAIRSFFERFQRV
jgi:hypothetical protein